MTRQTEQEVATAFANFEREIERARGSQFGVSAVVALDMLATMRTLAAAQSAPQDWRPIESAPKDGTRILLGWPMLQSMSVVAHWERGMWRLSSSDEYGIVGRPPVHSWQPLPPAAPAVTRQREGNDE